MKTFDSQELTERLNHLEGWSVSPEGIRKTYIAPTFHRAIGFVVQIAIMAEAADHHPDLDIRYDRVTVTLMTHSAKGVTEKDFALAGKIDEAFTA